MPVRNTSVDVKDRWIYSAVFYTFMYEREANFHEIIGCIVQKIQLKLILNDYFRENVLFALDILTHYCIIVDKKNERATTQRKGGAPMYDSAQQPALSSREEEAKGQNLSFLCCTF